jgi:hypothetical protein
LSEIADRHGDEGLIELLGRISPLKVADIIRNHDSSKTSLLFFAGTPAQKVSFLESEPLHWGDLSDYKKKDFQELKEKVTHLLINMIGEDENKGELLKGLEENPKTYNYLFVPFCGEWCPPEEMMIGEDDWHVARKDVEYGTNDHLFEMIRNYRPSLAAKIIKDERRKQLISEVSAEVQEEEMLEITEESNYANAAFTPLKDL